MRSGAFVRRPGIAILAAFLAAAVATGTTALAEPPSFSLSWQAPAACPGEAYLRGEVEKLLAGGGPLSAYVRARARIERANEGNWRVWLTTTRDGITGERTVESPSCRSLADATALIVALTIDPDMQPGEPLRLALDSESHDAPTTSTAAPSAPVLSDAPPSHDAAVPSAPPQLRTRILAQLITGVFDALPRTTYGGSVGAALMLGKFRLEGYGLRWSAEPAAGMATPSLTASADVTAGGLRGCFVPWDSWLQIAGCSGLELGVVQTHGFPVARFTLPPPAPGVPRSVVRGDGVAVTETNSTWIAATGSVRVLWRVAPSFGMVLDLGAMVPLRRDPSVTENAGKANLLAPIEGRVAIGPELRF